MGKTSNEDNNRKLNELIIEKKLIDELMEDLEEKKAKINEEINLLTKNSVFSFINELSDVVDNEDLFIFYLTNIKGLKSKSADAYLDTLDKMQSMLENTLNIRFPIPFYHINDEVSFKKIIDLFEQDAFLVNLNLSWHHSISAAYNNYYNFLISKKEAAKA